MADKSLMTRLLDCLGKTIQKALPKDPLGRNLPRWTIHGTGFIALTARFGVVDYVRARASIGGMSITTN
ncbi:hypothetical protein HYE67_005158 [Fusarium culmorum]|uniref:Uncharacterized protein n=1 Tax=Fusarium culmorum TaxID=5516 RepID=A0A7S8D6L6_FUSCU|nr:hypothetical protein HYE67_005158 [Fusarium culmorum]